MHISLRHLAAKMLSQLYNNLISFLPSFLPSYQTCSINVNSLFCSITSLTKVSKWGSQYHLNRNLGPYFLLGQGMLSQNPSPLTLLSFLLSPFLSRSLSPSAQSAEIVELPETTQEQEKRKRVAEKIPDTKHACWPPDIF